MVLLLRVLVFLGVFSVSFASVSDPERSALVDFYNSLDGANWENPENWLTNDPCENEWAGVACDDKQSTVLRLAEQFQSLNGTIPMSLANLTNLQQFILTNNPDLKGPIPAFYEKLQSLTRFEVTFNGISSDLPANLGSVQNLNHLLLNNNAFSGGIPDDMFGIAKYSTLSLDSNHLSGTIPFSLCKTNPTLNQIYFSQNQLTGTISDCFGSLPNAQYIDFSLNSLDGIIPSSILKLPILKELQLSENQFAGPLPDAFSTTFLENLDFSRNNFTGTIPDYFQNYLTGGALQFEVEQNQLTGQIPDWVCSLKRFYGYSNNFSCPNPSCCQNANFDCGDCS